MGELRRTRHKVRNRAVQSLQLSWTGQYKKCDSIDFKFTPVREYSTYRVVTTIRLKAPRHLVVNNNLKTFTKYIVHVPYTTYRACLS